MRFPPKEKKKKKKRKKLKKTFCYEKIMIIFIYSSDSTQNIHKFESGFTIPRDDNFKRMILLTLTEIFIC